MSYLEIVLAYVGAAATKSIVLGLIILTTASFFVPLRVEHPLLMAGFLVLIACTFSLFGFIIGVWAKGFENLQFIPMLIVTPLTFLGGAFYSIDMLPAAWRTFSLFNPVVYLISGFRWSFYGRSDVSFEMSLTDGARLLRGLPRGGRVDLQNGLPAQELRRKVSRGLRDNVTATVIRRRPALIRWTSLAPAGCSRCQRSERSPENGTHEEHEHSHHSSRCALAAIVTLALGLAACSQNQTPPAAAVRGPQIPFQPDASIQDLMENVVDHNADILWESVAVISSEKGIEERMPRTDEEWKDGPRRRCNPGGGHQPAHDPRPQGRSTRARCCRIRRSKAS